MKKLLRLGDFKAGGRSRDDIFDLLGMRVVVQPLEHGVVVSAEEAEAAARQACFIVQEVCVGVGVGVGGGGRTCNRMRARAHTHLHPVTHG